MSQLILVNSNDQFWLNDSIIAGRCFEELNNSADWKLPLLVYANGCRSWFWNDEWIIISLKFGVNLILMISDEIRHLTLLCRAQIREETEATYDGLNEKVIHSTTSPLIRVNNGHGPATWQREITADLIWLFLHLIENFGNLVISKWAANRCGRRRGNGGIYIETDGIQLWTHFNAAYCRPKRGPHRGRPSGGLTKGETRGNSLRCVSNTSPVGARLVPVWCPFGARLVPVWFPFGSRLVPVWFPLGSYAVPLGLRWGVGAAIVAGAPRLGSSPLCQCWRD